MDYRKTALKELLSKRDIFEIFDSEFQKMKWLNLSALQESESSIEDLRADGILPERVLSNIETRLEAYFRTR